MWFFDARRSDAPDTLLMTFLCHFTRSAVLMVLYGQLVCTGCTRVLSYPLGAISCRCRNCNVVNPAQALSITCQGCQSEVLFPINTLQGLCPCCCTTINIPMEMLPPVPNFSNGDEDSDVPAVTIYVENPSVQGEGGRVQQTVGVASKIL